MIPRKVSLNFASYNPTDNEHNNIETVSIPTLIISFSTATFGDIPICVRIK
ncbi:bacterial sugar transferase domain protein [Alteromonas macleodii]|uniref:Bacterial sugar transferase domain protein n=1 Tax=Alteromonas macleodii TaxID=28108 RepID=A0AB36FSR1_ALTMA|nr:bacterial sugar transferase domain protein [Alteromonas macleodii]OES30038.1 bacterial sugar transferase domain protein [Alteromonas macleodii]OES30379.1 bacterial sugar transferase domain protein [Alteromonas macleodii]OES40453.1 bacterial sugar transferase domain protein [Alteromonas macleodii]